MVNRNEQFRVATSIGIFDTLLNDSKGVALINDFIRIFPTVCIIIMNSY